MRGKDIQIVLLVAVVSAIASILLSDTLFSTPEDRSQKVETAEAISSDFQQPDSTYFNGQSFNPAENIDVGQDPGSNPFQGR